MIRLQRICSSKSEQYLFMENLLIKSFPPEEYRALKELRTYTEKKNNFYNNIIYDDDNPIGLLTYWEFKDFFYIEHFATDPSLRNNGYGSRTLEYVCKLLSQPIVLEVEYPTEELSQRRISFYQRQGFTLWENNYQQPPYKQGDKFIPMYLMVHGSLNAQQDFEKVKKNIHNEVYGLK